jgi:hypothetical protein
MTSRIGPKEPAGWRNAQLCGLCSFRLQARRGFALRQP